MDDTKNEKGEHNDVSNGYVSDDSVQAAQFLRDEYDLDVGRSPEEKAAIVC